MEGYTYLAGVLMLMGIWGMMYLGRRDVRTEMLVMSVIMSAYGLILESLLWTKDWWHPPIHTIAGLNVGIEDLLLGFGMGGVAAVLYEEFFHKRLVRLRKKSKPHWYKVIVFICFSLALTLSLYRLVGLSNPTATILGMFIPTILVWLKRPDLISNSLLTGLMVSALSFVFFAVLNLIEPGFVQKWWMLEHLSGIIIGGVPLEDLLWFFAAGLFIAPIYEYWQGRRLGKMAHGSPSIVH